MTYTYKKSNNFSLLKSTGRILGLDFRYGVDRAKIRGQLQTLFGDPVCISSDPEYAYDYVIIMENDRGIRYIFDVYSAKFGPSIGGNINIEGIEDAAQELKQYIEKALPSDYEYQGTCPDRYSVIMGVKDGEPYYSEFEIGREAEDKATRMGDSELTLDEIFEEAGLVAKWEARGEARGIAVGEEKGRQESILEIARKMKEAGRPFNEIMEFTGLPIDAIELI